MNGLQPLQISFRSSQWFVSGPVWFRGLRPRCAPAVCVRGVRPRCASAVCVRGVRPRCASAVCVRGVRVRNFLLDNFSRRYLAPYQKIPISQKSKPDRGQAPAAPDPAPHAADRRPRPQALRLAHHRGPAPHRTRWDL